MPAWKVVQDFIEVLKAIPEGLIPAGHIGVKRPSRTEDLPTIVVAIRDVQEAPIGIGGLAETQRVSDDQWVVSRGTKVSGILSIEIWASDEEEMNEVANAVFQAVGDAAVQIREKGFIRFSKREVGPMEEATAGRQATVTALRMVIRYSIVYEEIKTETIGPGGIIKQVHVAIGDEFDEKMELP